MLTLPGRVALGIAAIIQRDLEDPIADSIFPTTIDQLGKIGDRLLAMGPAPPYAGDLPLATA